MKAWVPIFFLFCWSCNSVSDDEVEVDISGCPPVVEVGATTYKNAGEKEYALNSYSVHNNTLKLNLQTTGCNFLRNFRFLVNSEKSKSNPPIQEAKLVFTDQPCQNQLDFMICFDLSAINRPTVLQITSNNGITKIALN